MEYKKLAVTLSELEIKCDETTSGPGSDEICFFMLGVVTNDNGDVSYVLDNNNTVGLCYSAGAEEMDEDDTWSSEEASLLLWRNQNASNIELMFYLYESDIDTHQNALCDAATMSHFCNAIKKEMNDRIEDGESFSADDVFGGAKDAVGAKWDWFNSADKIGTFKVVHKMTTFDQHEDICPQESHTLTGDGSNYKVNFKLKVQQGSTHYQPASIHFKDARLTCQETTSGPGSDEIYFAIIGTAMDSNNNIIRTTLGRKIVTYLSDTKEEMKEGSVWNIDDFNIDFMHSYNVKKFGLEFMTYEEDNGKIHEKMAESMRDGFVLPKSFANCLGEAVSNFEASDDRLTNVLQAFGAFMTSIISYFLQDDVITSFKETTPGNLGSTSPLNTQYLEGDGGKYKFEWRCSIEDKSQAFLSLV